jgi:hypothetical protein
MAQLSESLACLVGEGVRIVCRLSPEFVELPLHIVDHLVDVTTVSHLMHHSRILAG